MNPRLRGAAVLVVALLAVLVTAGFNQRITVVTGDGVAVPPLGPPSPGQCLLQQAAEGIQFDPPKDGLVLVPPLAIGECDGIRYGEVFLVEDSVQSQQMMADFASLCSGGLEYMGLDPGAPQDQWQPTLFARTTAAGPDPRQITSGQRWVACVVMPAVGVSYEGSLRGSISDGQVPKGFGTCLSGPTLMEGKECDAPHQVELFAYKQLTEPLPNQGDLDAQCEQIVQLATMMPDIFAGGALSVRAESPRSPLNSDRPQQ